jgi:hypothetical protein
MPKIYTYKIVVDGKYHAIELRYSREKKFSLVGIPRELLTFDRDHAWHNFETERKAMAALNKLVQAYELRNQVLAKVILYQFNMTEQVAYETTGKRSYSQGERRIKPKAWVPKILLSKKIDAELGGDGVGFKIEWRVLLKSVQQDRTDYFEIGPDGLAGDQVNFFGNYRDDRDRTGYFEIPWTAEREQALHSIDDAVEGLCKRIAVILSDTNSMAKLLDSGVPKLLQAPGDK